MELEKLKLKAAVDRAEHFKFLSMKDVGSALPQIQHPSSMPLVLLGFSSVVFSFLSAVFHFLPLSVDVSDVALSLDTTIKKPEGADKTQKRKFDDTKGKSDHYHCRACNYREQTS